MLEGKGGVFGSMANLGETALGMQEEIGQVVAR
jgi:hypothetical protein